MLETVFALLAAVVAMIISGILVKSQNKNREELKDLTNEKQERMENIAIEVETLTRKEPVECTLDYLEQRIDAFDDIIILIKVPTYKKGDKRAKR